MSETETYNGWKNYETWNVALWIGNDEGLYSMAMSHGTRSYRDFAASLTEFSQTTGDGVPWDSPALDYDALDEMMSELVDA